MLDRVMVMQLVSLLQILKDFMSKCLRESEKERKRTIVFNAMGTGGYLCYPKDVVAKLMYNAVADFDARQPKTWLKEVTFCVYGQDKETIRVRKKLKQYCR